MSVTLCATLQWLLFEPKLWLVDTRPNRLTFQCSFLFVLRVRWKWHFLFPKLPWQHDTLWMLMWFHGDHDVFFQRPLPVAEDLPPFDLGQWHLMSTCVGRTRCSLNFLFFK